MAETPTVRRGLPAAAPGVAAASDRRFRRASVRFGRKRSWRSIALRLLIVAGGASAFVALVAWIGLAVTHAAVFQIDRVVVHGNKRLAAGEVRALLDDISSQSIFHVDLEEYRVRLLDSPWVEHATLWRVFPSSIEVRLVERVPLAVARLNRQMYLVDSTGSIIDSAGPEYREFDLPVVDGLLSDDADGALAEPARIELLERLLAELGVRADILRRVSQIDVSDERNAVVLLDGEPARLFLGDREFLARVMRYEETAPTLRDRVRFVDYYDLRFERPVVRAIQPRSEDTGRAGK
jgi:cell division protein FtsQ